MKQPHYILENGIPVVIHTTLDFEDLAKFGSRSPGSRGVTSGVVGGYGGDVYWVTHDPGTAQARTAAYCFTEFEFDSGERPQTLWDHLEE